MGVFEDVIMGSGGTNVTRRRERRSQPRVPNLRVASTGLSASLWELELVPPIALARLERDIAALASRAEEPNIFFDPLVLQAAWPRLNGLLAKRGCWMACLWETMGSEQRRLRLFLPIAVQRTGIMPQTVLQPLANEFMPIGTPLVDPETAGEACETLLQLLADPALKLPHILDMTWMRSDGAVTRHLVAAAERLGLPNGASRKHDRAVLTAKDVGRVTSVRDVAGKKTAKEFARLNRRLEETAPVSFHIHTEQEAVLDAFEAFIGLELAGWKGRRATALYNHKKITAFSREISARLAVAGACEIVEMRHGTRVIASLILFGRGGDRVTWKIAFAEDLYKASPGQQVMIEATLALLKRQSFARADSLAVRDHPMINRLWPDRLAICDMTIALDAGEARALQRTIAAKERWDRWRGRAKRLLEPFRSR